MAKDNFRQIERIEINPETGEKRIIYKAKGIKKLKEKNVLVKVIAILIVTISAFSIFSRPKEPTPESVYESFDGNTFVMGWEDYKPNLPRVKETIERFAGTFKENTIKTIDISIKEEFIIGEWQILDGLRQWLNSALSTVFSFLKTTTNIGITAVNSVINCFKFLASM